MRKTVESAPCRVSTAGANQPTFFSLRGPAKAPTPPEREARVLRISRDNFLMGLKIDFKFEIFGILAQNPHL